MPIDYSKGKVYCLRSQQTDLVYVGSTCQSLSKRLGSHRVDYKCYRDGKGAYLTSFEIIQYEDCYIELIEKVDAKDKCELLQREGHHMRELKAINKQTPGALILAGSKKQYDAEYRQKNIDTIRIKKAEYHQKNRDTINARSSEWYHRNKEACRAQRAEYRQKNRDSIKAMNAAYYQTVKAKRSEKHQCPCGGHYVSAGKQRHLKTTKHKNYEAANQQ